MKKFFNNTIVQLLIAVIVGIVAGFYVDGTVLSAIVSLKHVSGQVIFFLVPLIILGFIAPSIAHLRSNASKMLLFAFGIAYLSSIGASFFGAAVGYQVIPHLDIASDANALKALPENMLKIDFDNIHFFTLKSVFDLSYIFSQEKKGYVTADNSRGYSLRVFSFKLVLSEVCTDYNRL